MNGTCHVGVDDSGTDLVYQDSFRCEAVGIKRREHGDAGFGHAVFPAVCAADHGGTAGDVHNHAPAAVDRLLADHLLRYCLGQEHVSLGIGVQDAVETLLSHGEQVSPFLRRDAGVVDQYVDPAKSIHSLLNDAESVVVIGNVCLHIVNTCAECFQYGNGFRVFFFRAGGDHDHVVAIQAKLFCCGETDAPAGTCNNRGLFHLFFSCKMSEHCHNMKR